MISKIHAIRNKNIAPLMYSNPAAKMGTRSAVSQRNSNRWPAPITMSVSVTHASIMEHALISGSSMKNNVSIQAIAIISTISVISPAPIVLVLPASLSSGLAQNAHIKTLTMTFQIYAIQMKQNALMEYAHHILHRQTK